MSDLPAKDAWLSLSRWTPARIGLGRVGASVPTHATLDFAMDHARARDAIHTPLDVGDLDSRLEAAGFQTLQVRSQARNRTEYLSRPDLGRRLAAECATHLAGSAPQRPRLLTIIVADGLSSLAPSLHALPMLEHLRAGLAHWTLDAVIIATEARVGLADEVGHARGSEATIILIGERPGLKAADSLGAYLTYRPRPGCTDADRNCVSNIRADGLDYAAAAARLIHLLHGSRQLGRSGVDLKDDSDSNELLTDSQRPHREL